MSTVNKAILVGRLGKDPETRFTTSGKQVTNFSMATDEAFKDRNGERQTKVEWHDITLWDKLAEIASQYLSKGSLVYIEGRIETQEWDDKRDGSKRSKKIIVANTMRMLSSNGNKTEAPAAEPEPVGATADSEEIPF